MSKLNPQKATAYVGPGVLRKGGKITPVPNGPLIKKKGPYAGSTLKTGGKIKKAMLGAIMGMAGGKDNPIYKKTTEMRGKIGSAALGMPGMKPIAKGGKMIKRADGSMSKRGLWDNLRSKAAQNKKTGAKPKAPTKAMLTQEKKIKAKK